MALDDPFPAEEGQHHHVKVISNKKENDDVYPRSRYKSYEAPHLLYIPNREIMFKIMRASINLHTVENLWIYDFNNPVIMPPPEYF